jgi:hypothetical protein
MEVLFEKLLREKIALMLDMRRQTMEDPGFGNFEDYKHALGYLEALRRVLDACDEVNSDMRKD